MSNTIRPRPAALATGLIALSSLLGCVSPAEGPPVPGDGRRLTLDRLHSTDDFRLDDFGPIRWLEDGSGYTTLEKASSSGRDIVRHDPETGEREVLVAASALVAPGADRPLGIEDYQWSVDGSKVLIFTDTHRVWRRNTRGDYWVLDRDAGTLRRLGDELERGHFQFAKFSPAGDRVAYVHRNDLYLEELGGSSPRRLTRDGSPTIINGTFDWVYEEEWSLRDGFRWSPDGASIAFWQIDSTGVREFVLIDNTSGLYPELKRFPYPKVGEENPAARVGIVDVASGEVRWLAVPGDPRGAYIARMDWAGGSSEVMLQHVNRRQNEIRVLLGDRATGEVREIFVDRDEAWVEVCDDVHWLDEGRAFTWVSERDGWRHVYVVSRDGSDVRLATPGPYDVMEVVRIDDQWIYLLAAPEDPTQRFLFRMPLSGTGDLERLTPDPRGTHGYQVSADGRWALHTRSAFGVPPVTSLIRLPGHEVERVVVDNQAVVDRLLKLERGSFERFRVDVGNDVILDGWCLQPPGFDPFQAYPAIVFVYGEPAGQTVRDAWGGGTYLWHLYLVQQGYVVLSIDNRGTPAPRGRDWRKCVYGKIGILASEEQEAALRKVIEQWGFIDPARVGVWGWSGGGSMSLNLIFRYPDLFQAAIAIAFVANQRYYDTIYQERYMGLPDDNPEGFRDGSPITHAHRLRGDLLLVYGTGDDNCHYQNCEALIDELVRHDKAFEMMAYPNRSHGIHEGEGTRKHLYRMMERFWREKLPPGPVPPTRSN